jgi:hypothetical protein
MMNHAPEAQGAEGYLARKITLNKRTNPHF